MSRGAGVGIGKPSQPGDVPRQLDDALVVDVVQHEIALSRPSKPVGWGRPWRLVPMDLYMVGHGGNGSLIADTRAFREAALRKLAVLVTGFLETQASGGNSRPVCR